MNATRPRNGLLFALCAAVLLIGFLDYITGPTINMTLFYLAPVVAAGWTLGQRRAVAVAVLAGTVSLFDVTYGLTTNVAFLWNVISRTLVLAIAAFAVDLIRRDRERLMDQDAQRARSLQLLDRGLADPALQLVELADHWDGSVDELKALVRRRADEMMFLARDFSAVVRLQSGALPLNRAVFDFVELTDELRAEQSSDRQILMTGPSSPLPVHGDRARTRQVLSALIAERASTDELSFLLDRRAGSAELVISSGSYKANPSAAGESVDTLGLSADLAQLLFTAQGGSVELTRNPLTRSLRITARLPLAT
jgi:hypothetical protein